MTNYLKLFNAAEADIEEISMELLSIDFHPNNFFVISQKLDHVARTMEVVGAGRDSALWKTHWQKKLTDVVEIQWQQALLKGIELPMTVSTVLSGKKCTYSPELPLLKEKYFKELKHYIGWPLEQKFLLGDTLLDNSSALIVCIYAKAEQLFEQLELRLEKYEPFEKKLMIDIDHIEEKLGRDEVSS
jgi:hypothetical protein